MPPPPCMLPWKNTSRQVAPLSDCACDCDVDPVHRWFSTNSRTLDGRGFSPDQGMSYRGVKNTTFNGMECLPWNEVFSMCTEGFEDDVLSYYKSRKGSMPPNEYKRVFAASFMSYFTPDKMGLRGGAEI